MALDRDEVVEAALAILDTYGLADLSMRRLADALGVKAGAIYWHLPNKQTLLAAVADRVLEQVPLPQGTDSSAGLADWAHQLRDTLLRHRDSAELVASTQASRLGTVDVLGPPVALVTSAGHTPMTARAAARALLHLVLGHVVTEQNAQALAMLGLLDAEPLDEPGFDFAVRLFLNGLGALEKDPPPAETE